MPESGGYGGFALTVQCYLWGANTAYGAVPQTVYANTRATRVTR